MKKLSFLVLAFLSSAPLCVQGHGLSLEEKSKMVQAYGYIRAQDYLVNFVANKYPRLTAKTLAVKNLWNSRYPHSKEAVIKHLKCFHIEEPALEEHLKKDKSFIKTINLLRSQTQSMSEYVANQRLDYFIDRIKSPAGYDREISLILNDLVFDDHPEMEWYVDRQTYSTKGHPKAVGLDFRISVPSSWKQSEGVRPHIVQKWTKRDDHGVHSIMIVVADSPDMQGYWTRENLSREVRTGGLWDMFSHETVVNRRKLNLSEIEKLPCAMLELVSRKERAGKVGYVASNIILFGRGNKVMSVQLTSSGADQASAEASMDKYSALAQSVFNSIYLPDQW